MQRGHNFAIVDEVDSILIDEARTPLIISGPAEQSARWYARVRPGRRPAAARARTASGDYEVDESKRTVGVTERGVAQGRGLAGHRQPLRVGEHPAGRLPEQRAQGQGALQARQGLHRQRRRGPDRRRVHRPHPARPPLQRGHAPGHRGQGGRRDQAGEPDPRHDHPAELLPPLREALRHDRYGADRGRRVQQGLQARRGPDPDPPADDPRGPVRRRSTRPRRPSSTRSSRTSSSGTSTGQPVLVGTVASRSPSSCRRCCASAAASRTRCSTPSTTPGRPRSSPRRAARAPSPSPPTWPAEAPTSCSAATPSSWPPPSCAAAGLDPDETPEEYETALARGAARRQARPCEAEHDEVIELGGLYVLGTERHESRRIDNQLRGRSGRQGDPGESRFYLSLQDDLMRRFNAAAVEAIMDRLNIPEDVPIESKMVSRPIELRPDPDRGAERRDPQERPQVRRGPQQAAPGDLRRAPPGARRRGPARADPRT